MVFLLSREFPGRDALLRQVPETHVAEECSDRCGSIVLQVNRERAPEARVEFQVPVQAFGKDADGMGLNILLHVDREGYLEELELVRRDSGPLRRYPLPDELSLAV